MSDTDLLELEVGPPAHGGHCVARWEGRVVFVRHALPGERVRARVLDRRSRFWRAEAVDVLDPAPDRVPSVWPEAGPGGVGGGELAHVALPAQRRWKQEVLADTLRRIGGPAVADDVAALLGQSAPTVEGLPGDDETDGTGSRTRIELTVDPTGLAGMHRHRSHDVLALRSMPLAVPAIAELGLLGPDSVWRSAWHPGARVEVVAPGAGQPLVLVDGEPAGRRRSKAPARRSVREVVPTRLGELDYRVAARGFWQTHRRAPETLVEAVLEGTGLGPGERVLELYSGSGLLTLPMALAVGEEGHVTSVEGAEPAVRDARRNLHAQRWAHLRHGGVDPAAVAEAGGPARPDVVVLDPPRTGAGAEVMRAITDLGPRAVVHVACDPAALARDLGAARACGYTVTGMRAFDLFPHTHHMEVVASLSRR